MQPTVQPTKGSSGLLNPDGSKVESQESANTSLQKNIFFREGKKMQVRMCWVVCDFYGHCKGDNIGCLIKIRFMKFKLLKLPLKMLP